MTLVFSFSTEISIYLSTSVLFVFLTKPRCFSTIKSIHDEHRSTKIAVVIISFENYGKGVVTKPIHFSFIAMLLAVETSHLPTILSTIWDFQLKVLCCSRNLEWTCSKSGKSKNYQKLSPGVTFSKRDLKFVFTNQCQYFFLFFINWICRKRARR